MLGYSLNDMQSKQRRYICQLTGQSSYEFSSMAEVSRTSGKEKARPETLLIRKSMSDGASDGRLASSSYTAELKNPLGVFETPFLELTEEVHPGIGITSGACLVMLGIESSPVGI